jgi:hypothetical protein
LGQRKSGLLGQVASKRGSIDMKCYMTGQEKGDLLIQVTTWAGLPVSLFCDKPLYF